MFILRSLVEQHTKKGSKPLYTCFIDFRKAFDSVWIQGLFYKMRQIGISDKFYKIVKEMYSKTKLCVNLANSLTEFFQSNVGVRQWDNMNPNLFKIFIHDIQKELDSSYYPVVLNKTPLSCLLYADDMILNWHRVWFLSTFLLQFYKICHWFQFVSFYRKVPGAKLSQMLFWNR
jgi:hypothetical protein